MPSVLKNGVLPAPIQMIFVVILDPMGYDGKIARWEKEDNELSAKGIRNPWEDFPKGRSRNWL